MQLPIHTCSFTGGMNKDISVNSYPNTCYFDAKNFRVVVDEISGITTTSLSTPKGNKTSFTLPADVVYLGSVVLRDYLVVFGHDTVAVANQDKIYKILISELTKSTAVALTLDNIGYWTGGTHYLVYQADLGFNVSNPIRVVGNYENADVQKIYWVDGLNTIKHLNIIYNALYNPLDTLSPQLLEILPNHTYGTYTLSETAGGHLKAGRIQYSYQLYSSVGTETMFAPPSNLYNLSAHSPIDNLQFAGSEIEDVINKSIKVQISLGTGTSDSFNRIRLIALEYEVYGDVPTVRIVAEQELSNDTPIFTDSGNTIGELVLEEFQSIKNDLIPSTIESKNNYLFAGNIKQEYFDIDETVSSLPVHAADFLDTRAYRWRYVTATATYECTLNKGLAGELTIDNGLDPVDWNVSETHDCINTFNNIANDNAANYVHEYKYKEGIVGAPANWTNIGGTGKYISYQFNPGDSILFPLSTGQLASIPGTIPGDEGYYMYSAYPDVGYEDPQNIIEQTGHQRDEVYRYALVLYDLKGRPSYSKWIADIRFPRTNELLYSGGGNITDFKLCSRYILLPTFKMRVLSLGIKFTIDWPGIEADFPGLSAMLSGFQIVRCPRTDDDCTVKASGIIVPMIRPTFPSGNCKDTYYSTYNYTSAHDYKSAHITPITHGGLVITQNNATMTKELVELLSPEIAVNKELAITANDFLEVCGYLDDVTIGASLFNNHKSYSLTATNITSININTAHINNSRRSILDGFVSQPESWNTVASHTVDSTPYTPRGYDGIKATAASPLMTYKGTSLVVKIASAFGSTVDSPGPFGQENAIYGRYRRYLGYSAYGGNSYSERSYSQYIKASEFQTIPAIATSYTVFNGDVYIAPFNFLKLFFDYESEFHSIWDGYLSGQSNIAFPVESRINIQYGMNNYFPSKIIINDITPDYFIAEKQSIGVLQYPNFYPNIGDLYRYNSAYSAQDLSKLFIAKPYDFRASDTRDTLIASSEQKFPGEYSDSWLKFKYNNYLELEGKYGAITRLLNHNENLLAFQPRGIAKLSILERETVQTNNTQSLAIGTGGILSRYDYLSKSVGSSIHDAICQTEVGIYFYDEKTNNIYRILEALEPLGDVKGMKSYFEKDSYSSLIVGYDRDNKEVLFSPLTSLGVPCTEYTLAFSGYVNAFEGFFTFNSGANYLRNYINFDKYLLSSVDGNTFYIHNVGNVNEFYGVKQTSSLTLIANPSKTNVVTFHIVSWNTDLTDSGVDVPGLTFDTLQLSNSHQDTGVMTLSTRTDLSRRFRKWRINTFRDVVDSGRIRDSWTKATFTWLQNSNNKKLVVHPIEFHCLPTKL